MTLYLTDRTDAGGDRRAPSASGFVHGCKLYPAGATTNSDAGVTDIAQHRRDARGDERARPAAAGARRGHRPRRRRVRPRGALHRRGARAAARALPAACASCSSTSRRARPCSSCRARAPGVAATDHPAAPAAQPQRDLRRRHPPALLLPAGAQARSATARRCSRPPPSGDPRFFLGTDSAPHARARQGERLRLRRASSRAHAAIELYAEAFEAAGRAAAAARASPPNSRADFYGLPRNDETHHAGQASRGRCRRTIPSAPDELVPLRAGETHRLAPRASRMSQLGDPPAWSEPRRRRAAHGAALPRLPARGRSTSRPAAFNARTDALLEIAAVLIEMDATGRCARRDAYLSRPAVRRRAAGSGVAGGQPASIRWHPLRPAMPERDALQRMFREIRARSARTAAAARCWSVTTRPSIWGSSTPRWRAPASSAIPFHPFSCFDTATLAGAALGQTVLAKARDGGGSRVGHGLGALGDLRRRAHGRPVLPRLQRAARAVSRAPSSARALGWKDGAAPLDRRAAEPGTQDEAVRSARRGFVSSCLSSPLGTSRGDVAAADQLAVDVELRIGRPVRIALERLAQLRILEDIDVHGTARRAVRSAATVWAENPHCGKSGVPFMNSTTGCAAELLRIRSLTSIAFTCPMPGLTKVACALNYGGR